MKARWMDKKAINKLESETWKKEMILSAAYLMDEFGYDEERVCEFWDGMNRYLDAVKGHIITINKVIDIIEKHTGIKILWKNGDR